MSSAGTASWVLSLQTTALHSASVPVMQEHDLHSVISIRTSSRRSSSGIPLKRIMFDSSILSPGSIVSMNIIRTLCAESIGLISSITSASVRPVSAQRSQVESTFLPICLHSMFRTPAIFTSSSATAAAPASATVPRPRIFLRVFTGAGNRDPAFSFPAGRNHRLDIIIGV